MKKLISLSLAALCLIGCAAGCGKKDDDSDSKKKESKFVGKWECSELKMGGTTMTDLFGVPLAALAQVELKDGGTMTMISALDEEGATGEGKWKEIDEDTVEITVEADGESETMTFDYADDKLVFSEEAETTEDSEDSDDFMDLGDVSLTFIKVDKFTEFSEDELKGNLDFGDIGLDTDLDDADWDIDE